MDSEDQGKVRLNSEKHRFETVSGELVAIAEYRLRDKTITFTHTKVPAELEGRGVGAELVKTALDYSREHGYRVIAECPFVAAYIRRHPQYADLLNA
jgi:predicted GNAT family acetyltransferase